MTELKRVNAAVTDNGAAALTRHGEGYRLPPPPKLLNAPTSPDKSLRVAMPDRATRPPLHAVEEVTEVRTKPRITKRTIIVGAMLVVAFVTPIVAAQQSSVGYVETGSMSPTIAPPSYLIGWKTPGAAAERGDIITFSQPSWGDMLYVKRVIGVGGDTVEYRANQDHITINGEHYYEDYLKGSVSNVGFSFEVPEGHYFVLGDNRGISDDSRTQADPFIPAENLVTKPFFIFSSHELPRII